MPGDDLLFQRLSVSTIGAARFHGRVRDGIGWGTGAMATKQWGRRVEHAGLFDAFDVVSGQATVRLARQPRAVVDGGILQARTE